MEQTNMFTGAMDLSTSPLNSSPNKTHIVKNMRPNADINQTGYSLSDVKGNVLHTAIPNTPNVFRIKNNGVTLGNGIAFSQTYNTTVGSVAVAFTYDASTVEEFFEQYKTALLNNPTLMSIGVRVAKKIDDELTVWLSSSELITSIVAVAGLTVTLFAGQIYNPLVIGYTSIRDTLVIFTTANNGVSLDSQIWKIPHVAGKPQPIELVYHGPLGFNKNFPIQAIGLYEANDTQRVYWTDNNTPVKSINISDPDSMALDLELVNLQSGFKLTKVRYGDVTNTGALPAGVYQYAYRLKGDGFLTKYSHLSSPMHIVSSNEATGTYWRIGDVNEYIGTLPGAPTSKAIQCRLTGLDNRYKEVEIISIFRKDATSVPIVTVIEEQIIPISRSVTFTHTGREIVRELHIDDFLFLGVVFDRAKSISTKDNLLILSNVRTKEAADLVFNSRAYRWNNSQQTYVGTGVALATDWQTLDPFASTTRQKDKNAINPFNNDPNVVAAQQYKYQSDGVTLGGEGPYIKYSFVKRPIDGDTSHSYKPNATQAFRAPFVNKSKKLVEVNFADGYPADQSYSWEDYKNPLLNGSMKGYQRGEIYRFAIVLYDFLGRPSFANWIGDIRFPEQWDVDGAGDDYRLYKKDGYDDTTNIQRGFVLGLEFEVTIPNELRSVVRGYSIVRVAREDKDKTRLADGMLQPLAHNLPGSVLEPEPAYVIANTFGNQGISAALPSNEHVIGYFPEFLLKGPIKHAAGDRLIIHSTSEKVPGYKDSTGMQPFTEYWKLWDMQPTKSGSTRFHSLTDSSFVAKGRVHQFPGEDKFCNYTFHQVNDDFNSVGNDCFYMQSSTTLDWAGMYPASYGVAADFIAGASKFFATYERRITDQYGGADEFSRSKNTYISVHNFVEFSVTSTTTQTFEVFGGDTYITFFGNTSGEKNIAEGLIRAMPDIIYPIPSTGPAQMTGHFFPAETTVCNELRTGYHLANKADPTNGYDFPDVTLTSNLGQYAFDQYLSEEVYSHMNPDEIVYIPPPVNLEFVNEYDYSHYVSNKKIYQERSDSWRMFSPFSRLEMQGVYGPINHVQEWQDQLYSFQDNAIARLVINPKALIPNATGTALRVGSTEVIPDYEYLTTQIGGRHKWSVCATDTAMYWFNSREKSLMSMSNQGITNLSVVYGIQAYLEDNLSPEIIYNDNPVAGRGICVSPNKLGTLQEVLFTFHDIRGTGDLTVDYKFTLCFTESHYQEIRGFTSFYSFTPGIYINFSEGLITPSTAGGSWNDLYLHNVGEVNTFYGIQHPCYLSFFVSPAPTKQDKRFFALSWITQVFKRALGSLSELSQEYRPVVDSTWSRIRVSTVTKNTGWINLTPGTLTGNVRNLKGEWRHQISRNAVKPSVIDSGGDIYDVGSLDHSRRFKEHMDGLFIRVELERLCQDGHRFYANSVTTALEIIQR